MPLSPAPAANPIHKAALAVGAAALMAVTFATSAIGQVTSRDRAQAQRQHPQILAEFGGELAGPANTYVKAIGEKMAVAAGQPGVCTFTLINSDVVNAFAVPGCYIYITRGLLAIMNSEDELASVLGHEVGHITGQHSQKRQQRATLSQLGAIAAGVLTKNAEVMQMAGQVAQLYTLSYSRGQEFDADDRGIAYLRSAGYNTLSAAEMLNSLGLNDAVTAKTMGRDTQSAIPTWARTHPLTSDRVTRAAANARAGGPTGNPELVAQYFAAIDGMIWGDDPDQGFVNGNTFAHPKLKIAFEAPQGFTLTNGSDAITIQGPNGLRAQFSGGRMPAQGGLQAYTAAVLQQVVGQSPARVGQGVVTATNNLQTAILPAQAQTQSGQVVDIQVTAYQVGAGAYHFVTLSPAGQGAPMAPMLRSMRQLSDAEAAALRPRVVDVVQVRAGDTVQSLAARMAFTDFQVERFLALNGLAAGAQLQPGQQVKIIVMG